MATSSLPPAERARKFAGLEFDASQEPGIQRAFSTWASMLERCFFPSNERIVATYAARGITVCERWFSFANFLADMGHRPAGRTLDRINNDGHYEPGNCRWATPLEQSHNSRSPKWLVVNGERITQTEAASRAGVSQATASRCVASNRPIQKIQKRCCDKLDATKAELILKLSLSGEHDSVLAAKFGVSRTSIRNVRTGRTWK